MSNNYVSSSSSSGIGLGGALTVLFVALKLLHKIDWPWIWVVSPIWISIAGVIAFFVLFFGLAAVIISVRDMKKRKAARR